VSATGVVAPEEFVVKSPAPEGGGPLDVLPAELLVGEFEAWLVVGCVATVGGGVPDADEPSDPALGGGGSVGGVGAGEVVVGGGVGAGLVGGAVVAVGGAGGGGAAVGGSVPGGSAAGGSAAGGQPADVPVPGSSVGRHVTCAAAWSGVVAAWSAIFAAWSAIFAA
jgi:hypothetical protein